MKKKAKRNLYRANSNSDMEYAKIIKIAVGVVFVLAIVYLVTAIATGEIKLKKEKEEIIETRIQYEEIMAGEILNRSSEEYYVILFNFTDNFASYYLRLKDIYSEQDNSLAFYIVDLEKKLNTTIVTEEDGYQEYPNNIKDLKVKNPTILKVKNHAIVDRIVGRDDILKFFEDNK